MLGKAVNYQSIASPLTSAETSIDESYSWRLDISVVARLGVCRCFPMSSAIHMESPRPVLHKQSKWSTPFDIVF